ncbi:hypothetical protein D6853_08590 [Butyrivibrio sp. X503]|uniref:hypothetical protein n=1 Tax=Butyrivibrio sp. X503 TaxID=2364878 RepID=UPI000EA919CE|nr:hypothetical protein [Butyrivibrio sp. X503]RKM55603.1 hypothetical protein D6853_08590 [Butyrivibrio sp. X503]
MAEVQFKPHMAEPVHTGANTPVSRPKEPVKVKEPIKPHEDRTRELIKEDVSKREDIRTKEYGPVIARSSDGDTVRVKKEDIQDRDERDKKDNNAIYDVSKNDASKREQEIVPEVELPEIELKEKEPRFEFKPIPYEPGEFLEKTKQEAIKAKDSAREIYKEASIDGSSSNSNQTVGSYSDSMLKEMYLKGDISQISYEREMEAREEQRKAREMDDRAFSNDMADETERLREMERTGNVIRDVETGDVNTSDNAAPLEDRLQAMQNIDNM